MIVRWLITWSQVILEPLLLSAELALLSLAEVLLGPLWVWLFIGETSTLNTLTGGAVLLGAIAGNALSGKRRRPPPITSP